MTLYVHELVDLSAFQYIVDFSLRRADPEVDLVEQALIHSFEFGDKVERAPPFALCTYYMVPLRWLSCMIVRGSLVSSFEMIVEFIAHKGEFGGFDLDKFCSIWPAGKKLKTDKNALMTSEAPGFIGVYLPMGLMLPVAVDDVYTNFNTALAKYESLFASCFKIPSQDWTPCGDIQLC
jgi:hypothetical protein